MTAATGRSYRTTWRKWLPALSKALTNGFKSSCGFYITAENADKRLPQDEQCGGLFCETTHFTCSSDYNISFSCTNTTYLDSNGNAQGITIFVATDCDSNERTYPQDPRYSDFSDIDVLVTLSSTFINATYQDGGFDDQYDTSKSDPAVIPTCLRGCLCAYSSSIYDYCDCPGTIANIFVYLAWLKLGGGQETIYTTPSNLSLLSFYFNLDSFEAGLGSIIESYTGIRVSQPVWVNISEGSNLTLQRGFECFGDYLTDFS